MRDMTSGAIHRHLLGYALPMVLGNVLQLTYNAVDSIIIGKCLGENALAAVSAANPIITIMVLGASGIGIGAAVLMSRFYGARQMDILQKEFATTEIFSTLFSFVVFALGMLLAPQLLAWINTPAQAFDMAVSYLRIIFVGFLFTFQYNILSNALRSIGDSKTPVYFLSLSCGLNVLLDVLLVMVFPLGVTGAALATTLSEAVSVVCCICWIAKKKPELHIGKGGWHMDRALLKETVQNGSLTALQQAAQPVGKVMIQSVINSQGVVAIDAFNAACKIDDYARIPTQTMGSAIMTCTAQNRGAGNEERVRKSLWTGLLLSVLYYPLIFLIVQLIKTPAIALLLPDNSPAMLELGVTYLGVKAWFFVMPCLTNGIQGYFRGMGKMHIVLIATIIQISIRTLCVYLLVPTIGIVGEAWGCFIGWFCMLIFEFGYYCFTGEHHGRTTRKD